VVPRVTWVTNDLPPRSGGIQQFVVSLLERTADAGTLVLGPAGGPGAAAWDRDRPWRTERWTGRLVPGPRASGWLADRLRAERPDVVVIASLWPLGLAAPRLRRAAAAPLLGLTHGAEAGLARTSATRPVLRAVARHVDLVSVISDFTAGPVAATLGADRVVRLAPGVDLGRFRPVTDPSGRAALRAAWGVPPDAPVVGCVARLVPRKGQDVLIEAWPEVLARHPGAWLVLVGEGPDRRRLARAVARTGRAGARVVLAGRVPWEQLPAAYAALDVFAMPVRTRWAGLDVEGLGISVLEALATGLPVVVGRSGGAVETVPDPRVGTLVDGRDPTAVATALDRWLADGAARRAVADLAPPLLTGWAWDRVAADLGGLLTTLAAGGRG
jgi:phosphatidylinositol alpha-1,6-mannosyltransferase